MRLHAERLSTGGPPLLLLHGFTGSAASWSVLDRSFFDRFSLVAVDLPGHGRSPLPESMARGFDETLEALVEVIDREQLGRPAVLGYSMGARVALGLALRAPTKVSRLVLESGSPGLLHRRERDQRVRADEALASKLEQGGLEDFVAEWEQLPLFEGVRRLPDAVQAELRARRLHCTVEGLAGSLRTLGTGAQPNLWFELQRLRVPTLLVTGALDLKFTDLARKMIRELSLGWRTAIPGVSHVPHLEAPAVYAREVLAFLDAPWDGPETSDEPETTEVGRTP